MSEDERWNLLVGLDEELLIGGAMLSEWCSFIVREADIAFAKGADLASILTAVSGIETYLRSEYDTGERDGLFHLVSNSPIKDDLKADIHRLRVYRNRWVHVAEPSDDSEIREHLEKYEDELEKMAIFAARTLRKTIYENQWL